MPRSKNATQIATDYLTPEQAAARLQISRKTVVAWMRDGKLRGSKIGYRTWRVTVSEIEAFLKRQQPKKERG
jgi:excisionase family DNA binding protein